MVKGLAMTGFGLWVAGATIFHLLRGTVPDFTIMGSIGLLALAANVISAGLLIRHRDGDINMRSVWLCSRNDAIGNVAVMAAAAGVFATDTGWPDVGVAALMAALAFTASWQVTRQALRELRAGRLAPVSG